MQSLRSRIHQLLEPEDGDRGLGQAVNIGLLTLIVANVAAVIVETVPGMRARYGPGFDRFETFSVTVFTVEYVLRLWTCLEDPRFRGALRGRLRFAVTPLALVDLVAILPAFIPAAVALDLRYARVVRVLRMMRLFKASRYSTSVQTFFRIAHAKRADLTMVSLFLGVLLVIASSSVYFAEHEAQPEAFSSIPAAMWWGMAALTTVGYGDVVPRTVMGKLIGSLIAFIGIAFFALPAGILAAGYADEFARIRAEPRTCPHCGRPLDT